jgi:hypothetical protein
MKEDMIRLETKYLKITDYDLNLTEIYNNYYSILSHKDVENVILKTVNIINSDTNAQFSKQFNIVHTYFKDLSINYNSFNTFKNSTELLQVFLSFFIIKQLLENNFTIDTEEHRFNTSDDLINAMVSKFTNLLV